MITAERAIGRLFLSRLPLNPMSREVMRSINNSQSMHTLLLRGFPDKNRSDHNLLYRFDAVKGSHKGLVDVIVQSTLPPDWTHLHEKRLLRAHNNDLTKNISALPEQLEVGCVFRFRLRANPTKRIPWDRWAEAYPEKACAKIKRARKHNPDKDLRSFDGPRVAVTDYSVEKIFWVRRHPGEDFRPEHTAEEMLINWLRKQGERCGFQIANTQTLPDPLTGDMQYGDKASGDTMAHKAIVFDGLLRISDLDAFRHALVTGIGGGKAYGFGLLSLASARGWP